MSAGGQWHPTYFGLKGNSLQRLNQERGISMAKKKVHRRKRYWTYMWRIYSHSIDNPTERSSSECACACSWAWSWPSWSCEWECPPPEQQLKNNASERVLLWWIKGKNCIYIMFKVKIRTKGMQYTVRLYGCGGPGIDMRLALATYYDALEVQHFSL